MSIEKRRALTVSEIDNPAQLEPVIANHILTGKTKSPLLFPGDFVRDDVFVHKRLRHVQYLIEQFWSDGNKNTLHRSPFVRSDVEFV